MHHNPHKPCFSVAAHKATIMSRHPKSTVDIFFSRDWVLAQRSFMGGVARLPCQPLRPQSSPYDAQPAKPTRQNGMVFISEIAGMG